MTTIPEYLEDVLSEADEYYEKADDTPAAVAHEISFQNESIIRSDNPDHDLLDVIKDLREIHQLCADEFETYREHRDTDYANSILEAIALRSLEDFIHAHLSDERTFGEE